MILLLKILLFLFVSAKLYVYVSISLNQLFSVIEADIDNLEANPGKLLKF